LFQALAILKDEQKFGQEEKSFFQDSVISSTKEKE